MARLKNIAAQAGYSNVDEFITHVLEKELEKIESTDEKNLSRSICAV
jgi:hypothetical protein